MGVKAAEVEQTSFDEIEKSFNASLEGLRKSLGMGEEADSDDNEDRLEKAGKESSKMDFDDEAEEADEDDEEDDEDDEDEEYEEEKAEKSMPSIEDQLAEDPLAEAAVDVSPFLKALVKAIDNRFEAMERSMDVVRDLAKSIGKAQISQMELVKSQTGMVTRIANEDRKRQGLKSLQKSRFGEGEESVEVSGMDVLRKSQDWVRNEKISLVEAGLIERRVNHGILGKSGDPLDQKVANLIKEAK